MNYLAYEVVADSGDLIEVLLDHAANVQLLDPSNYRNYRRGTAFRYYGGYADRSPYRIQVPYQGHWHLVIDLGGAPGTVRASARVISAALQ